MTVLHAAAVPVMERYEINVVTGCWLWLGYVDPKGYAQLAGENAHRAFYRELVGVIEDGNDIDHLCKRRNCVNPAHLESVTEQENIDRITRTVRYQGKAFDICREGHPMSGDNLRLYKRGDRLRRACAECARVKNRARAHAKGVTPRQPYRPRVVNRTDIEALLTGVTGDSK